MDAAAPEARPRMGFLDGLNTDALLERVLSVASEKYIAPLIAGVRAQLCSAIAGDVPPAFGDELDRRGLSIEAGTQKLFWECAIAAAASLAPREVTDAV
jgi:hypothetical protein